MSLPRVLIAFALATVFFAQFSQPVFAQTQPVSQSFAPPPTEADVPQNTGTLAQTVLLEFFSFVACQTTGVGFTHPEGKCLEFDASSGKFGYAEGNSVGLVGFLTHGIAYTYNMPTSTGESVASLYHNFGIVKSVQAQEEGVGFSGLSAFQKVWETSRNIVYSLFVILFLIVGIGIMLRRSVDPRTVMSVQNQLPKIIVGLLLITFSYAIAGFLIDLMWVSVFLVLNVFNSIGGDTTGIGNLSGELHRTPFGFANNVVMLGDNLPFSIPGVENTPTGILAIPAVISSVVGIFMVGGANEFLLSHDILRIPLIFLGMFHPLAGICYLEAISPFQVPSISDGFSGALPVRGFGGVGDLSDCLATTQTAPLTYILGALGAIVVFFVVLFALLIALFKLWIVLIKAFVKVIIGAVLAPFWIAIGLIPGSEQGFEGWIRFMVANLAPFPVVIFMFAFARFLLLNMEGSGDSMFVPPLVGNSSDIGLFTAFIALGIILLTPDVVKKVQEVIGAQGEGLEGAVGSALTGGGAAFAAPRKAGEKLFARNQDDTPRGLGAKGYDRVRRATGRKIQSSTMGGPIAKGYHRAYRLLTGAPHGDSDEAREQREREQQTQEELARQREAQRRRGYNRNFRNRGQDNNDNGGQEDNV